MLVYAIVLIIGMLCTNNPKLRALFGKILPKKKSAPEGGGDNG